MPIFVSRLKKDKKYTLINAYYAKVNIFKIHHSISSMVWVHDIFRFCD
jgi:hypothetical protein